MAEREGFEPPIALRLCLISSQVHSTGLYHLSAFGLSDRPFGVAWPATGHQTCAVAAQRRTLYEDTVLRVEGRVTSSGVVTAKLEAVARRG